MLTFFYMVHQSREIFITLPQYNSMNPGISFVSDKPYYKDAQTYHKLLCHKFVRPEVQMNYIGFAQYQNI